MSRVSGVAREIMHLLARSSRKSQIQLGLESTSEYTFISHLRFLVTCSQDEDFKPSGLDFCICGYCPCSPNCPLLAATWSTWRTQTKKPGTRSTAELEKSEEQNDDPDPIPTNWARKVHRFFTSPFWKSLSHNKKAWLVAILRSPQPFWIMFSEAEFNVKLFAWHWPTWNKLLLYLKIR